MPQVLIELERLRKLPCGLGQFCKHLGQAILDEAGDDLEPVLFLPAGGDRHFRGPDLRSVRVRPWHADIVRKLTPGGRKLKIGPQPDLWHATYQDTKYLPWPDSIPIVLTVHDLNFLREKSPSAIRRRLRRLQERVDRATILTSASEFAANEIREHVRLSGKQIVVISHGVCLRQHATPPQRPAFLRGGPILFTIGDVTPKKNFHVLVEMLTRIPDFQLVIAGSKTNPYATALEEDVARRQLQQRVLMPGVISDSERWWLYQNCEAFLFPSLSEGFGLPVIEALSCGKPVFCSDRTSLPEVGGGLAHLWTDFDPDAMAEVFRAGMAAYRTDPSYADRARQHVEQFDWNRSAAAYLDLYREVLGQTAELKRAA